MGSDPWPQFHEKTPSPLPRNGTRCEKSAKFWAHPSASGPLTLRALPTLQDLHFFWVWAPTLSGPSPFGAPGEGRSDLKIDKKKIIIIFEFLFKNYNDNFVFLFRFFLTNCFCLNRPMINRIFFGLSQTKGRLA